jgi:hypothetical protein
MHQAPTSKEAGPVAFIPLTAGVEPNGVILNIFQKNRIIIVFYF